MSRLHETGETLTLVGATTEAVAAWTEALRRAGRGRVAVAPGPAGLEAAALAELVAAGIEELRVRLYAVDAKAHDYHAGVEGSARATIATLRAARAARLRAVVTTPLTRSNARVLAGLPGLLADVGAAGWRVLVPAVRRARPDAIDEAGRVAVEPPPPRLGVVVPYALQAIAAAERVGVPAAIEGVPLCLLGPMRDRCLPSPRREYADACEGCPGRQQCQGVDAGYLARFGDSELAPRGVARTGEVERQRRLGELFAERSIELGEGACWPI